MQEKYKPNQKFETVQVLTPEIINRLVGESVFSNLKDGVVLHHSPGKLLIDTTSPEVLAFRKEIEDIHSASLSIPELLVMIARATMIKRLRPATEEDLLEIAAGRETVPLSDYINKGKGDCVQVAALAQLAFQEIDIESYIVSGDVINNVGDKPIPHLFNLANLDGIKLLDFPQPIILSPGRGRVYVIPGDKVDLKPGFTKEELEDSSDDTQFYRYAIVAPPNSGNRTYFLHSSHVAFPHFRTR